MKFSTPALALFTSLALAEQTEQYYDNRYSLADIDQSMYQWPQSDYVYQMAAQRDNRNLAMRTDGRNLYFGDARNFNGSPLRNVNVFVDIAGDLNIVGSGSSSSRYVGVDDGRLALSTNRRNNINFQRYGDDRVSWRYNDQQHFQACPVNQYGQPYDVSDYERSSDHLHQVYVGQAPCSNPVSVSLNGARQNGLARYQDSQLRIANNQRFRDSRVVQNDGRLMLVDQRNYAKNYNNPFRGQLSYRGQLVDNQGRFVQLGNHASMRFTDRNQVRNGLTGFSYRNNRLTYQNQGFIACQVENGVWDLRPTAVEAAAAACNNPQYVEISMEPLN
ncbi:hypothetical protein CJU90_4370 [Yarrowia sp. C11]|nr:hypothetical protein CKK34_6652 [Yarrowia sp. E02]KAG5365301.1 hypothetical protein CJU90_4370 [Yarrowia sp. C11]